MVEPSLSVVGRLLSHTVRYVNLTEPCAARMRYVKALAIVLRIEMRYEMS
jgi:hypothetical protein